MLYFIPSSATRRDIYAARMLFLSGSHIYLSVQPLLLDFNLNFDVAYLLS